MYNYIKKLEHGYPNKKGLKRLNCLYEKKLFDEMYKLDKIAGQKQSKNSYIKKVIWKRYGLRFVIFSLVLLFGIIVNIVCYFNKTTGKCVNLNGNSEGLGTTCKDIETALLVTNGIAYIPFIIIFITYTIYILSKVRKYKRLKKRHSNIGEM
ncbi:hypothetical protein PVMG_06089 [Plasmodium vivax Mauritania I]|uniref:Uncharacterized protein n=1 Tax=Plasmodium vivax Mauritania I TaxID=1035515 RepID=A0A0J9TJ77_PLAVI|nr:hypothetical protein PVMG_06089 [Plasmodium vivax Mauritania I]